MKIFFFFLFIGSLFAVENSVIPLVEQLEQIENRIRIATYNVLFNITDRDLDVVYQWPRRLPRVCALIQEMQPDILGVQELYPDQQKDLIPYLEDSFGCFAPNCKGERNAICYNKNRFELLDSSVWEMPNNHSSIHIAETLTMVHLFDRITKKEIAVFNTHLAHAAYCSPKEREDQVRFIIGTMALFVEKIPTVLLGDLNTFMNRKNLKILPFYDGEYICNIFSENHLVDSLNIALLGHVGPLSSFSNAPDGIHPFMGLGTPGEFLDHILVNPFIRVLIHASEPGMVDGYFPSDHFPVLIDCILD